MDKKDKNKKDDPKNKGKEEKKKPQIQLRVFEEDDYFEEFEEGKIKLYLIY